MKWIGRRRLSIPRVLSVAPLKLLLRPLCTLPLLLYSTRPKRGPIEALQVAETMLLAVSYSTRPKRGPIEALIEASNTFVSILYSTRPKRGPIEARQACCRHWQAS